MSHIIVLLKVSLTSRGKSIPRVVNGDPGIITTFLSSVETGFWATVMILTSILTVQFLK